MAFIGFPGILAQNNITQPIVDSNEIDGGLKQVASFNNTALGTFSSQTAKFKLGTTLLDVSTNNLYYLTGTNLLDTGSWTLIPTTEGVSISLPDGQFGYGDSITGITSSSLYKITTGNGVILGGSVFNSNVNSNGAIIGGVNDGSNYNSSYSAIFGGAYNNNYNAAYSAIIGGQYLNNCDSSDSTIVGGLRNTNTNNTRGSIIGGYYSTITNSDNSGLFVTYQSSICNSHKSVILGGDQNIMRDSCGTETFYSSIISGNNNTLSGSQNSVIIGGYFNTMEVGTSSIIMGNNNGDIQNTINSILGASTKSCITNSDLSVNMGGNDNSLFYSHGSTIMGSQFNYMCAGINTTMIGGNNNNTFVAYNSSILGGQSNSIQRSYQSSIIGGQQSVMGYYSSFSSMIGGLNNYMGYSGYASIIGGNQNAIRQSYGSTIIGGVNNNITTSLYSAIIGGEGLSLNSQNNTVLVPHLIINDTIGSGIRFLTADGNGNVGVTAAPSGGGTQGPTGPQGLRGATGPQGASGTLGSQGPQGTQGPQGATGSQGSMGSPALLGDTLYFNNTTLIWGLTPSVAPVFTHFDFSAATFSSGNLIETFQTNAGYPNTTVILPGTWSFYFFASTGTIPANQFFWYYEVDKHTVGGASINLFNTGVVFNTTSGTASYRIDYNIPIALTMSATDRLLTTMRYGNNSLTQTGTVSMYYEAQYTSYTRTTLTTGYLGGVGSQGIQGPQGAVGSQGPQGTQGTQGSQANTASFYIQGGNMFGATATIGTIDGFNLQIETNNTPRITVGTSGNVSIGIPDTSGSSLLRVGSSFSVSNQGIVNLKANGPSGAYTYLLRDSIGNVSQNTGIPASDILWNSTSGLLQSFTLSGYGGYYELNTPSSNRTITLATTPKGAMNIIANFSTSSTVNWSFAGLTVSDISGNTITTLINNTCYQLMYNGAYYRKIN